MKYDHLYMDIARRVSKESYANRLKVGTCILTENGGLFIGFNGTLSGFPNVCEDEDGTTNELITNHAEQNALYKMLKEGVSALGATIYITSSPCAVCCKMIISSGIKRVVYDQAYRDLQPIEILKTADVQVDVFNSDKTPLDAV